MKKRLREKQEASDWAGLILKQDKK